MKRHRPHRPITIIDTLADKNLFQPWFAGPSWHPWRTILKAAFGLPMSDGERAFFRTIAEREPPSQQVRELWVIAGRRAGKDSVASLIAAHAAALFDQRDRLRRGERALVMCLACDRDQAKIVLGYTRSYFDDIPMFGKLVSRRVANGFELSNGVDVVVATNSFRSTRGRTVLLAIFDEAAFWRDELSATPDEETYQAIKPGMATLPGSLLVGISTPYRRSGLLYKKWKQHYGQDVDDVLVVRAPSIVLNPTLDQIVIDKALEEDRAAASAEWLAQWRSDIENFISHEVVEGAVVSGRHELPPVAGVRYAAFTDPSGGSADSMTLAIAHAEKDGRVILDAVRERKPPFSPDGVVEEFADLLDSYGCRRVHGDRYAGEWPRERFRVHGITYDQSEKSKSDLYLESLPLLNSGRVELLDLPRLISQLCGLERRTARSGKDSIDHAPGGHDDLANAVAGAVTNALTAKKPLVVSEEVLRKAALPAAPTQSWPQLQNPRAFFSTGNER